MNKPCPPGKTRNPETKRCRKVKSTSPKPCPPGKTRNPVTKRCRKVKSTSPKPCPPGKTRNPVTKRCRKVKSASPKILNKTRTPSLTRKRTPTKSQVKVKEFDTGLYIDGDDFISDKEGKKIGKLTDADNGVIEFFDKTSSIKTQSPKPKQKFKDRVLPDVMYLDGFEIYPDELYQVRDDLYIDTNNILFEFNDTTKKLREIGEWDSLKETPILNK